VLAALALVLAFTGVFVSGFHDPRPNDIEVAIVGSAALSHGEPDGFDVRSYPTESEAREALLDADVHGVLIAGGRTDRVLVTGAYGGPPTEAVIGGLRSMAAAEGRSATVRDLEPLPAGDPKGLSALFTVLGTVVPSLILGALLAIVGRGLPATYRWAALVLFAGMAGLVVAFSVDTLVGALTGHFWGVAGVTALLALAVGSTCLGLGQLLGPAGVACAFLALVLLGQSSAGGAITYELQPGFHHALSQLFPNGAALTALRNTVYFGGAHTLAPLAVLLSWAAAGAGLGLVAIHNTRRERST
jgi:hypothetical protein